MRLIVRVLRHRVAHWLGWITGQVVSRTAADGVIYVGFQCSECGALIDEHRVDVDRLITTEGHTEGGE